MDIEIVVANATHATYAKEICRIMAEAAKQRGTGIARREPTYIEKKMKEKEAIIAVDHDHDQFAGFCYIESWEAESYIANSGLIVHPHYRKLGLARRIKKSVFELSQTKYPDAKVFGITTSMAVMKINSDMGYKPVTFSELTQDQTFWKGCQSCPNYDILTDETRKGCLCTGMLYEPSEKAQQTFAKKEKRWSRFMRFLNRHTSSIKNKTKNIFAF